MTAKSGVIQRLWLGIQDGILIHTSAFQLDRWEALALAQAVSEHVISHKWALLRQKIETNLLKLL